MKIYHLIMCLNSSFIETLFIVSYPRMMLNEKAADCTNLADNPLKNIWNFSSRQSSWKACRNESSRWTWSRARTMSRGFVMIVVVKPPKLPAMHWMRRWLTLGGRTLKSSSGKNNYTIIPKFYLSWFMIIQ